MAEFESTPLDRIIRGEHGYFTGSGGTLADPLTTVVRALDAATGAKRWEYHSPLELWSVRLGGVTKAPPISFTSEGRQVIAVSAGRAMFLFGL